MDADQAPIFEIETQNKNHYDRKNFPKNFFLRSRNGCRPSVNYKISYTPLYFEMDADLGYLANFETQS